VSRIQETLCEEVFVAGNDYLALCSRVAEDDGIRLTRKSRIIKSRYGRIPCRIESFR